MNVEFYGGVWHGQQRQVDRVIPRWVVEWCSVDADDGSDVYVARRFGPRWYYLLEGISDDEFLASKVAEAML